MKFSFRKTRFMPGLAFAGFLIFAVPVVAAIAAAIWLTAAAAYENVKFVRGTDQLLSLMRLAHADATADSGFGQKAGEDLINDFVRRGQIASPPLNSWGGEVRMQIQPLPFMRVETDVPVPSCRRLAFFFGKNAQDFNLQKMEGREGNGLWQLIYNNNAAKTDTAIAGQEIDYRTINAACGDGPVATLALTLGLR